MGVLFVGVKGESVNDEVDTKKIEDSFSRAEMAFPRHEKILLGTAVSPEFKNKAERIAREMNWTTTESEDISGSNWWFANLRPEQEIKEELGIYPKKSDSDTVPEGEEQIEDILNSIDL